MAKTWLVLNMEVMWNVGFDPLYGVDVPDFRLSCFYRGSRLLPHVCIEHLLQVADDHISPSKLANVDFFQVI